MDQRVRKLQEEGKATFVCPEEIGGLSTPREPAEIIGGDGKDVLDGNARVVTISGHDVTEQFLRGAHITLNKALAVNARIVVLKESSPSCGSTMIYDGTFTGKKIVGNGVTAALLKRTGIKVVSEKNLNELLDQYTL